MQEDGSMAGWFDEIPINKQVLETLKKAITSEGHLSSSQADEIVAIFMVCRQLTNIRIKFPQFKLDLDRAAYDIMQKMPRCKHPRCQESRKELDKETFLEFHNKMNAEEERYNRVNAVKKDLTSVRDLLKDIFDMDIPDDIRDLSDELGIPGVTIVGGAFPVKENNNSDDWDDEIIFLKEDEK